MHCRDSIRSRTLVSIKAESAKNFYNGDKLSVVDGVFTIPAQSKVKAPGGYFYLEKAPVNLDSPYRLSGEFKSVSGESGNRIRFGLILLTAKTSPLNARSINIVPDSETVLLADCSAADKKVKIKNGTNWKQDGICLIAFDVDPTGKQRDLPNNHLSKGLITAVRPVSDGVELELNAPVGRIIRPEHRFAHIVQAGLISTSEHLPRHWGMTGRKSKS